LFLKDPTILTVTNILFLYAHNSLPSFYSNDQKIRTNIRQWPWKIVMWYTVC